MVSTDARIGELEDRMTQHEIICAERYGKTTQLLEAMIKSNADAREDIAVMRRDGGRFLYILLVPIILIAFAAVFQESTIIEFVRAAATTMTSRAASPPG